MNKISVEISLYLLQDEYKKAVEVFLQGIEHQYPVEMKYSAMSTMLIGDYDVIMNLLSEKIKIIFLQYKAVFVVKISNACLE